MTLRLFTACLAVISLAACDQVRSFLPPQEKPTADAGRSRQFSESAAVEAMQLPLHPDLARREGDVLTIFFAGKPVATLQSHMNNCTTKWPVCEGWTFVGTAELKNPETGTIETFARVTWSYGQSGEANTVPSETYVVGSLGELYYIDNSEPLYSPSHSFMLTHDNSIGGEITILDWTGTPSESFKKGYTFSTLIHPDSWTDETHISGSELPDQGLVKSVISRQKDGSWSVQDLEIYDGQSEVKPGSTGRKLSTPPKIISGWRSSGRDMYRMQVHGYTRAQWVYGPGSASASS